MIPDSVRIPARWLLITQIGVIFAFSIAVSPCMGQQPTVGTNGGYPLQDVLNQLYPTSSGPLDVSEDADPVLAAPVPSRTTNHSPLTRRPDPTSGVSPSDWGMSYAKQDSPLLGDQGPAKPPDWWADPPALEPEPSPYMLRKEAAKHSPSLPEILNKGRYFAAAEALWMEPHFLGSTAMTQTTGTSILAVPFDFGYSFSPRFTAGFESEQGPGLEFKYWNYNAESDTATFTSDGISIGQTAIYLLGPERWTRITADSAGEQLIVHHELEAQSFDIEFFKEWENRTSRLNGILGLHYATLSHRLRGRLTDGGGLALGELMGLSEFEGFGPNIGIEYFRPIGHTKLELLGGLQISLLFGERDQLVQNSTNLDFNLFSADELLSGMIAHLGLQYMHHLTEHRTLFARTTFEAQHWVGGGTATNPASDFGLYGLTFGVGVNR